MSNETWERVKKGWDWVWNSDSWLSWVVALVIIFVFVKFVFFPILSLMFGTSLPLAGVESSSMDHQITRDDRLEVYAGYDPLDNTDVAPTLDSDGDMLEDVIETLNSTDPYNVDTDGDGLWDGFIDSNGNGLYDF